jgi:ankyrin repeat protein
LYLAIAGGNIDIVKLLITKGADVNKAAYAGFTPLHYAAYNNQLKIAILLIDYGADVDAEDNQGKTPLDIAGERNSDGIVDLLLNLGASSILLKEDPSLSLENFSLVAPSEPNLEPTGNINEFI